jgi:hypothetical protein
VWFPWAFWHAPLDFHRPARLTLLTYLLIRVVYLIPITIILTWFYNRPSCTLLTTIIFHAGMSTFPFVLPDYQPAFALVILFAIAVIFADRMWRRSPIPPPQSPIGARHCRARASLEEQTKLSTRQSEFKKR